MATTDKNLNAPITGMSAGDQAALKAANDVIARGQAENDQSAIDAGVKAQNNILSSNGLPPATGNPAAKADPSIPLPKSWGGTGIPSSGGSGSKSPSTPKSSASSTVAGMSILADRQNQAAQKQAKAQVDHAVQQGVNELTRAEEDAQEQFQTQQNQVDIDEAKALDNQALYAEARGDRGGIGQAQYGHIQATAMNNRRAINTARTKLSTDTQRQIADLRAQGEFQKADAVLQLAQTYLGQLMDLQKWGAEFTMQEAQFNEQIRQWDEEFKMRQAEITGTYNGQVTWQAQQAQKAELELLAQVGMDTAKNGGDPTSGQLAAMQQIYGIDQTWVDAQKLAYQTTQNNATLAAQQKAAAERCEAYVSVGIPPKAEDALAAGWDQDYINARIADYKRKNTKTTGSGGGTPKAESDVYQKLYGAGYRTEGEAYAALLAKGYTATEASNLRDYYMDWLADKKEQEEADRARVDNKGKSYSYVWGKVRDMHDAGATYQEVIDFMSPYFKNGSLTQSGLDYIIEQFGWAGGK